MINPMFEGSVGIIPRIMHFAWYVLGGVGAIILLLRVFAGKRGRG